MRAEHPTLLLFWSIGLALFWVVFLWGFFTEGPYSLGINAAVFLVLVLFFLRAVFPAGWRMRSRRELAWIVPIALIAASYALYANPFVKAASVPVVLVLLVVFSAYALLGDQPVRWGRAFGEIVFLRSLIWLGELGYALETYARAFSGARTSNTTRRVALGVVLLLVVAAGVIVPLLSAADPQFGALVRPFLDFLSRLVDAEMLWRVVVGVLIAVCSLAVGFAWRKRPAVSDRQGARPTDSIVSGIVIGGIFLVYLLFLAVQIKRLWVAELPIDFSETEILVKSGFWQLFFLSIINGLIFLATYAKTNQLVQRLLAGFTIASLLLVLSAAWRMALYVVFYGFSYEKFFASYTVLFCMILFSWLVAQFASRKQRDLVKFGAFLFLWMYAVMAVFPVEQTIARVNVALSKRPDSRIDLYELTMLSSDVLGYIEDRAGDPRFEGWDWWIESRRRKAFGKAWYEVSVSDIAYRLRR